MQTALLYGNPGQLGIQAIAVVAAIVYSGVVSFILLKLDRPVRFRCAPTRGRSSGLDMSQHGEEAYLHAEGSSRAGMA